MITQSTCSGSNLHRTGKRQQPRTAWDIEITLYSSNKKWQFSIHAEGLNPAKQAALQEFRRLNPEMKNLYLEARKNGIYMVVSNLDDVGEVRFKPYLRE